MFRSCISATGALKPVKGKCKQSRKHFFCPFQSFLYPLYDELVSLMESLFLILEIIKKKKKAWINCELRLSDQEKACKSESGGLEWCQQRDHSWAQRKNKDLRKTAMPRLRRVDLKLQGCAQPACISSILSWWAISWDGSESVMFLTVPGSTPGCMCCKSMTNGHVSLVSSGDTFMSDAGKVKKLFQRSQLIVGHHAADRLSAAWWAASSYGQLQTW